MRQAATHSQPIRHTIPPLFPPPVMLVQLINHHQSLEIAIHAPNVNKPNANWPNLNWMRDSRFSICDSRFDSIRFTASAFYFATSAGWNCVCNLFYYLFPSNNIRLGCRKGSTGDCPCYCSCSCSSFSSSSFVKVQLSSSKRCSKSLPQECRTGMHKGSPRKLNYREQNWSQIKNQNLPE